MKYVQHTLCGLACAMALALSSGAEAGVVTFDNPGLVEIDNNTGVATYTEGGFRFSGDGASYLPLDGIGTGGSGGLYVLPNSPLSLTAVGGGLFSLLSLDYGRDPFDPFASGTLSVHGVLGDNSVLDEMLSLGDPASFSFQGWSGLKEVTFLADATFVLDNVSVVPEPASLALVGVALAGLVARRRRVAREVAGAPHTAA